LSLKHTLIIATMHWSNIQMTKFTYISFPTSPGNNPLHFEISFRCVGLLFCLDRLKEVAEIVQSTVIASKKMNSRCHFEFDSKHLLRPRSTHRWSAWVSKISRHGPRSQTRVRECPKRLAFGTVDSLIGKLRAIFVDKGPL
jgi:hypothetical protein